MFILLKKSLFFLFLLTILMFSACDEAADLLDDPADDTDPPDAPSHFEAVLEDDGTIEITWQDNSDNEDGFKLEKRIGEHDWEEEENLGRNRTSYSFEDLLENLDHKFRIHAYNDNGESNSLTSDAIEVPFYAPTNLVADADTTSITLNWSDNSNIEDSYRILRKRAGGNWDILVEVVSDVITYTDSDELEEDVTYSYRVAAIWETEISEYSNEVNAQIGSAGDLDAPTDLIAAENDTSDTSIVLSWSDNSEGEEGFKIQRSVGDDQNFEDLDEVAGANVETFIDSDNITESVRYYYRVYAYEGQRLSDFSNVVWASVGSGGTDFPPNAPGNVEAELMEDNITVHITWMDVSDNEDNFVVQMRASDEDYETLYTLEAGSEEAYAPDLTAGSYDFRVKAVNEFGSSDWVNTATVLISGGPEAPDDLEVEMVEDHIRITWRDRSGDETGFRLERKVGENGEFEERRTFDANEEEFDDWWQLNSGTYYYYRVFAYNENGDSDPSNVEGVQFGNDPNEINAPTDLEYTLHGSEGDYIVMLSWTDNSDNEILFYVEKRVGEDSFEEIGETGDDNFDDENVFSGENYEYRVYAWNEMETSDYSNVISVTIPGGGAGDPPTDLEYTINGTSGSYSVELSWTDNSDDENEFGVERSMDQGATYTMLGTTYDTDFEDFTVADEGEYSYRVSEFPDSMTTYSNVVDVTIPGGGASGDTIFVAGFEEFAGGDTFTSPEWNMEDLWEETMLTISDNHAHSGSNSLQIINPDGGPQHSFGPIFNAIEHSIIEFWVYQPTVSSWSLATATDGGNTTFLLNMRQSGNIFYADDEDWHTDGGSYPVGSWYKVSIESDCENRVFTLSVNNNQLSQFTAEHAGETVSTFDLFFWENDPNMGLFIDDIVVIEIND